MTNVIEFSGDPKRSLDLRQELIAAGFVIECWDDGTRLTMTRPLQRQGGSDVGGSSAAEDGFIRN